MSLVVLRRRLRKHRPETGCNAMESVAAGRRLDFGPAGMWWEIVTTTEESGGTAFEAINVLSPEFGGPPLHLHPQAEESYAVLTGTLDVCVDREWRTLGPGESITVPAGVSHTLRNTSGAEVRLRNVHAPALNFETFFRTLQCLVSEQGVQLPPKSLRSVLLLSMLFTAYPRELVSVKPSARSMWWLAWIGRRLGYRLPELKQPSFAKSAG